MNRLLISTLLLILPAMAVVHAQEQAAVGSERQPLPEDVRVQLEERLATIESLKEEVVVLEEQLAESEGVMVDIFEARLDDVRSSLFDNTLSLASDVADRDRGGFDIAHLRDDLTTDLKMFPRQGVDALVRLRKQFTIVVHGESTVDMILLDRQRLEDIARADAILGSLIRYTQVAGDFGLDAADELEFVVDAVTDSAANRSVFLELAIGEVSAARSAASILPNDTALAGRASAAAARVTGASQSLQSAIALMNKLDLDTRRYRQQIVTATGELTTDVLDVGVVAGLAAEWSKLLLDITRLQGPKLIFQLLIVIVILVLFTYLAKLVKLVVERALTSRKVRMSHLLKRMVVSSARNLTIVFGILIALSQLGISLGPLLAGLGIAGFIVGFALQDTLSNFASGMMILIYRPFDVGDFVEAGGVTGKVDNMSLVNTTFKTLDNQVIIVPNNMIWQSVITNVTAQRTRRVDLTFSISYSDDIDRAKEILSDVAESYEPALKTPEPNIRVHELADSSVNLILRPWVRTEDYWDAYWDLTELVKKRFDEEGITIPFPQRDVHTKPA